MPGNEHQGVWASPLLETVFGPEPRWNHEAPPGQPGLVTLRGDFEVTVFAACELRRSYLELPVQWILHLAMQPRIWELLAAR